MVTGTKVNLNTANEQDLVHVEGIGQERAKAIVKYRNEHGSFRDWSDFKDIHGFSDELIETIKKSGATIE